MSTDPHGILYYGIDLGGVDRDTYRESSYDDYQMTEDWGESYKPAKPENKDYSSPEWHEWRSKLREWEKSLQNVVCRWYGAEQCERYVVHCAAMEKRVEYDEQIDLGECNLGTHPEADEWIKKFCERFKVPYKQPTWHLASLYF